MDWYDENIEEPIRDVVKLLRDNGFNTECSCGHDNYVQCNYIPEGEIYRLHTLLFNYMDERGGGINYTIELHHAVRDGHSYSHFDVKFPQEHTSLEWLEKRKKRHEDMKYYYERMIAQTEEEIKTAKIEKAKEDETP